MYDLEAQKLYLSEQVSFEALNWIISILLATYLI